MRLNCSMLRYQFTKIAGNLLTWGQTTYGCGHSTQTTNDNLFTPEIVSGLNNVSYVATGPYHVVLLTKENYIYTCGLGTYGRLGQGSSNNYDKFQRLTYFDTNSISIQQLCCGNRHTLALSKQGKVYSWGWGGQTNWLYHTLLSSFEIFKTYSPLGINKISNELIPVPIEYFNEPIRQIAAGNDLSYALGQSGAVYSWGKGITSSEILPTSKPKEIKQFTKFIKNKQMKVIKIKAVNNSILILFSDGRLYVIGRNSGGLFGTRQNHLIVTDNHQQQLTMVIDDQYRSQRIIDFEVSDNSLIFITNENNIFYSGMNLKYKPQKFPITLPQIRSIFAVHDSVGIIDQNGKIYFLNDQIISDSDEINGKLYISQEQKLSNHVYKIGGAFKLFYAITK